MIDVYAAVGRSFGQIQGLVHLDRPALRAEAGQGAADLFPRGRRGGETLKVPRACRRIMFCAPGLNNYGVAIRYGSAAMPAWPSRMPVTGRGPPQELLRGLNHAGCAAGAVLWR